MGTTMFYGLNNRGLTKTGSLGCADENFEWVNAEFQ